MKTASRPIQFQALRRAAIRATLAPSVDNTQPWSFVLTRDFLEIHADPARRLQLMDPAGRQMVISCGCALFNARVCLAAAGYQISIERYPDWSQPNLLARLAISGQLGDSTDPIAELDPFIELSSTSGPQFTSNAVANEVIEDLVAVAATEHAFLLPIRDPADRLRLELVTNRLPREAPAAMDPPLLGGYLLLLGTAADDPESWLHTGEALGRVLLEVARRGYAAGPMTHLIEMSTIRTQLRDELKLAMQPHVLIRIGKAPASPVTRRRRLVDMLTDSA